MSSRSAGVYPALRGPIVHVVRLVAIAQAKPDAIRRSKTGLSKILRPLRGLLFSFAYADYFRNRSAFFRSGLTWGEDRTETYAEAPERRGVGAAVRRPAAVRVAGPPAAPTHTVRA